MKKVKMSTKTGRIVIHLTDNVDSKDESRLRRGNCIASSAACWIEDAPGEMRKVQTSCSTFAQYDDEDYDYDDEDY